MDGDLADRSSPPHESAGTIEPSTKENDMTKMPDIPTNRPITFDEAFRALELLHSYFVITDTVLTKASRRKLARFTSRAGLIDMATPLHGSVEDEVRRQVQHHVLPNIRVAPTPGGDKHLGLESLRITLKRFVERA
jgi:hypothetical protein